MATILIADEAGLFVALETAPVLRVGCRLIPVRSPKELIARASTLTPDLILLDADLMEPGLPSCLRGLKADRKLRSVPIVIAAVEPSRYQGCVSDGDVVFQKPVSPEEVGAALRFLLPVPRRVSPRIPMSVSVVCRFGARRMTFKTKDVGAGGLFLKTQRRLPCGTKFEATFHLPDPGRAEGSLHAISAMCEVVRRVEPEEVDLIAGVGASFVQIGSEEARFIERFVAAGRT